MIATVRGKIDGELTKRIGQWFTVREIQDKLHVNPATLKPLIMRYARESVLKRRKVKGTARAVQFSPGVANRAEFKQLLDGAIPYRNFDPASATAQGKLASSRKAKWHKKAAPTMKRTAKKSATKAKNRTTKARKNRK